MPSNSTSLFDVCHSFLSSLLNQFSYRPCQSFIFRFRYWNILFLFFNRSSLIGLSTCLLYFETKRHLTQFLLNRFPLIKNSALFFAFRIFLNLSKISEKTYQNIFTTFQALERFRRLLLPQLWSFSPSAPTRRLEFSSNHTPGLIAFIGRSQLSLKLWPLSPTLSSQSSHHSCPEFGF